MRWLPRSRALAAAGLLDYVHVVAGTSASLGGSVHIVPPMSIENAYTAPLAERVRGRSWTSR